MNSAKFIVFSVPNSQKLSYLSSQTYFNVVYLGFVPFYYRYAYFNIHIGHMGSVQQHFGGNGSLSKQVKSANLVKFSDEFIPKILVDRGRKLRCSL